jgi:nitrogen fixation protein FixH
MVMRSFRLNFQKISQASRDGRRNPWVIGWFALLGIVLGVNAVMILLAVVTNPGLVVEDYYEQGRAYEKNVLKRIAARDDLSWEMRLDTPKRIIADVPDAYRFVVLNKHGRPLQNAAVKLVAYRPSDAHADFAAPMNEVTYGEFHADIAFPLKGVWDINIQVTHPDGQYDLTQRVNVGAR